MKLMSLRLEMQARDLSDKLDKLNLFRFEATDVGATKDTGSGLEKVIAQTLQAFLPDMKGKLVLVKLRQGNSASGPCAFVVVWQTTACSIGISTWPVRSQVS